LTPRTITATLLLALAMVASVLVLRLDADTADAYVGEDGFVEMFGVGCLLLGAAMAFAGWLRLRRAVPGSRVKQLTYLGLALFLFLAAGEELSWGQRLLGFGTPDAIRDVNAQGETTLHNLGGDDNGQNVSALLFQAAWMMFGVVVPLAAAAWAPAGRVLRRYLPVAPVWLALLFIGQQALWKPVQADFRSDPGAWNATFRAKIGGEDFRVENRAQARERGASSPGGLSEVTETNVELLLAVGAFCVMIAVPRRPVTRQPTRSVRAQSESGAPPAEALPAGRAELVGARDRA
jgi:hypothetical protein